MYIQRSIWQIIYNSILRVRASSELTIGNDRLTKAQKPRSEKDPRGAKERMPVYLNLSTTQLPIFGLLLLPPCIAIMVYSFLIYKISKILFFIIYLEIFERCNNQNFTISKLMFQS